MNLVHKLVTALVVTLTVLFVVNATIETKAGVVPPSGSIASLPIGDEASYLEYVVSNHACMVLISMTYTNYQNERIKPNVSGTFVFNSFASCQDAIQDKAYEIFNLIIQSNNCASTINFFAWMVYLDDINGGFTVNTNIGRIDKISRQSFRQRPRFANALVPVNNLQRYTLEVTGVYTNQWTPAAGWSRSSTPYSYEHATTTNIMFNEWYSYGMRRARFTIVDNGVTNTFTQHGALLSQPSANVRRSGDMMVFDVTIPKGADVSVILSPSIALTKTNWTTINYPWSTPFTSISYSMPRLSANSQFMGVSVK